MLKAMPKTVADYMRLEDTTRTELIDGEYVVSPNPGLRHQRIIGRFHVVLVRQIQDPGDGEVILSPFAAILSRCTVFQPDLLVLAKRSHALLTERGTEGAPDLVIEVLSTGTKGRDRTLKRRMYLKHGAREYWIVDPKGNTVQVLRRSEDRWVEAGILGTEAVLTTPLFPGVRIRLAEIFAEP